MEEGERRHHIMANHGDIHPALCVSCRPTGHNPMNPNIVSYCAPLCHRRMQEQNRSTQTMQTSVSAALMQQKSCDTPYLAISFLKFMCPHRDLISCYWEISHPSNKFHQSTSIDSFLSYRDRDGHTKTIMTVTRLAGVYILGGCGVDPEHNVGWFRVYFYHPLKMSPSFI